MALTQGTVALAELAREEDSLRDEVLRATGLMKQRSDQLQERGVFARYEQVHAKYAALAIAADVPAAVKLEALKRALFLQWYAVSEPECYSGIVDVSRDSASSIIDVLESLTEKSALDDELRWMLPWYFVVSDFYFEAWPKARSLLTWLKGQPAPQGRPGIPLQNLIGRGQLGDYWTSILTSPSPTS